MAHAEMRGRKVAAPNYLGEPSDDDTSSRTRSPPQGRSGNGSKARDEESDRSVLVHDVESEAAPPWRGLRRADDSSQRLTSVATGPAPKGLRPGGNVMKFNVSTQVSFPSTTSDNAVHRMADDIIAEVEEELDQMTKHRDALAKELDWYKSQLASRTDAMAALERENTRLRVELLSRKPAMLPEPAKDATAVPPPWWAAAKADLLASLKR